MDTFLRKALMPISPNPVAHSGVALSKGKINNQTISSSILELLGK